MKKYGLHIAGLVFVGAVLASVIGASDGKTYPKNGPEYAKTTAMILAQNKGNGGSGVILYSSPKTSLVLTNKHVCEVIQVGGFVRTSTKEVKVAQYKIYSKHDLCMIAVNDDLGVNTQLAYAAPALYTKSTTAGHPALLPVVSSVGNFSNEMSIRLIVSVKDCDGNEKGEDAVYCMFFNKKPVLKSYDAQLVSSLIMAGSSGSAVFNEDGEIAGLVFAGSPDGLSYGFIVPHRFVMDFVLNLDKYKWRKVNPNAKPKQFMSQVIEMREKCRTSINRLPICRRLGFQAIWSEYE